MRYAIIRKPITSVRSGDGFMAENYFEVPYVDEAEPVNTGLVSPEGDPIYRLPNPIGFGKDHEW